MGPHQPPDRPAADVVRFHRLWGECAASVLAYSRRLVDRDVAEEVVSETFLVAWRRLDDVPAPALPWLLGVARNTAANIRRTSSRQDASRSELVRLQHLIDTVPGVDVGVADRAELRYALERLTPLEREALLLTCWDGLSARQAARVAGCSPSAMYVRLHRARRRLRQQTAGPETPSTAVVPLHPSGVPDEA